MFKYLQVDFQKTKLGSTKFYSYVVKTMFQGFQLCFIVAKIFHESYCTPSY